MTTREQKARPALESIVDEMQKVLEQVCKEVNKQAKLYQESVRDQVRAAGRRMTTFWGMEHGL